MCVGGGGGGGGWRCACMCVRGRANDIFLRCISALRMNNLASYIYRGAGAGPTGTTAAGPMLEAKLMNLIKGRLQKF